MRTSPAEAAGNAPAALVSFHRDIDRISNSVRVFSGKMSRRETDSGKHPAASYVLSEVAEAGQSDRCKANELFAAVTPQKCPRCELSTGIPFLGKAV